MKASIQLTMEQPTMFRRLPSTLFGLLLIFLMVACTPATTTDESAILDDNLGFATDSSADSPDQASSEPPPATLTINGREQGAGVTGYCWQRGDGTSICADPIGFTTPPDSIPAESTFLAQFEYMLDAKPGRVHLSIFPASQPVLMGPEESDWRYWKSVPGDQFALPPDSNPSIELTLDPGLYVFDMFVDWPDYGGVNYGFLVNVAGALDRDSTAFVDDQGLLLEKATYRTRFEEIIGEFQYLLMAGLTGTYGGLWVEQHPEYRIMIALTEGDIETVRPYLDGYEWADFVEVLTVDYTLEELRVDQAIASQAADSVQGSTAIAVDIVNNRVELIVGNPDLFLADLTQAGAQLPESVIVLASDTEGELPGTNLGVLLEAMTPDNRVVYLPVQPPSEDSMMALMEGKLVEVDGCLRIEDGHYVDGWLVIWPFGSDIGVTDDGVEVIDEEGEPVARVGEQLGAGGGAIENTRGMESIDEMIPGMPIEGCRGPYWVAAPLETMVE
jgi:hypothetical protein